MTTGHRLFCEELLCFDTIPCRHMPLLVHFWQSTRLRLLISALRWSKRARDRSSAIAAVCLNAEMKHEFPKVAATVSIVRWDKQELADVIAVVYLDTETKQDDPNAIALLVCNCAAHVSELCSAAQTNEITSSFQNANNQPCPWPMLIVLIRSLAHRLPAFEFDLS